MSAVVRSGRTVGGRVSQNRSLVTNWITGINFGASYALPAMVSASATIAGRQSFRTIEAVAEHTAIATMDIGMMCTPPLNTMSANTAPAGSASRTRPVL